MGVSNIKEGMIFPTKLCGDVRVVDYQNKYSIEVEFIKTGYRYFVPASAIRNGYARDLMQPSLYGVGFIGKGKYNSREADGKSKNRAYCYWQRMIKRCYYQDSADYPMYGEKGVIVCEEWHNFQNFAKWFYEQKNHSEKGYHLDKDMLITGNKIYRPEACSIIPERVNLLCVKRESAGLSWHKEAKKWVTNIEGKAIRSLDATYLLTLYENFKRQHIYMVLVEEYSKGNIPLKMVVNIFNYVREEYKTASHPDVEEVTNETLKMLLALRGGLLGGKHE